MFEICGKNVKNQKLYREKIFKYIIRRITGDKHEFVRAALKSGDLLTRDFCRLSVKVTKNFKQQFEDLSYLKKIISINKQTNQSIQSNVSNQSNSKRILSKNKINFIETNEEKTSENTNKSSSNQESSGIILSSKSRDSDKNKKNASKNIYGEFRVEDFKTIIKEKVNFYKKDNGDLKEKLFSLENDMEICKNE